MAYEDPSFLGHEDPWHFVIKCRNGHIAPSGGDLLWASTNKPRSKSISGNPMKPADKLWQLAETNSQVEVKQDGDDGLSVQFHVSTFDDVARIMKPIGV